ncbi:type II toxin-antitoxin system RelE/ParE family toxin [Aminomonas paucivorans]|uniref:type II toxin-antitoxin system RelE/ParE family toxin n=1 Tax=Aminomonas paucivorans TaxID=81412 RepID=UPI0033221044
MVLFLQTREFQRWLHDLKDLRGKARILARLRSAEEGHFGDCAPVGEGVSEMRVHEGPGYRVYFAQQEQTVYLLLCGGDKTSQKRDIRCALALWARRRGTP